MGHGLFLFGSLVDRLWSRYDWKGSLMVTALSIHSGMVSLKGSGIRKSSYMVKYSLNGTAEMISPLLDFTIIYVVYCMMSGEHMHMRATRENHAFIM